MVSHIEANTLGERRDPQALESLAREGLLAGVLDVTTTELADELAGGFLTAGPQRLTAAAERGVPQLVSVGALDMVNFFGMDTVPERYRGRRLHRHEPGPVQAPAQSSFTL